MGVGLTGLENQKWLRTTEAAQSPAGSFRIHS